ncbi:MAG TPA: LPS-assembly protein LptD, partial [Negativicutes bacterium]|nr:LPS-assembly protein LptD [Negativicutes bacterium]
KLLGGLFLAALVVLSPVATAAAGSGKDAKPQPKAPIVIEADEIYFSDLNGTMFAKGSVVINQDKTKLMGELIRGNAKQNEIWIDDKARYKERDINLVGSQINYNYGTKNGTIAAANGVIGDDFVTGQKIELINGEYIIHDGTLTGCPAKVPDYHVSATKVEIWPGEKMIAYNAKFWIKNTVIYSMPKYQKSLRKDATASEFPRIGQSSSDGTYISQHLEYPFNDSLSASADLAYYSKTGFRPLYGLKDREKSYELGVVYGYSIDGNDHWVKREPEFSLFFDKRQLFSLPINYSAGATYGRWSDVTKSSWQRTYSVYFSSFPIKLGPSELVLGTGIANNWQSYTDKAFNRYVYDATLTSVWSPGFSTFLGYHYRRNMADIFAYNRPDMAREGDFGFSYKLDPLNRITLKWIYDIGNSHLYDADVTWSHNLHCWQADVTYRIKRSKLKVTFVTKKF